MKPSSIATIALLPLAGVFSVGCRNSLIDRSLIFSTHTSLGLEIAVSPSETDSPAKLLIGYKRSEMVLNPVYHNLDARNGGAGDHRTARDYYLEHAYSVIAKFEGKVEGAGSAGGGTKASGATATATGNAANAVAGTGGTGTGTSEAPVGTPAGGGTGVAASASVNGGMTLSQWFATGRAAEILAANGAASVLTDNPVIGAAEAAKRQTFGDRVAAMPRQQRATFQTSVYELLGMIETPEAREHIKRLDTASVKLLTLDRIDIPADYDFSSTTQTLTPNPPQLIKREQPAFRAAVVRLGELETSAAALKQAKLIAESGLKFPDKIEDPARLDEYVGPGKANPERFDKTIKFYEDAAADLRRDVATLPEYEAATRYLAVQLGLKE